MKRRTCAVVVLGVLGTGGCSSINVRDLQVAEVRVVRPAQASHLPEALRRMVREDARILDDGLVEVTLSTESDLIAVVDRDDGWWPGARIWFCDGGEADPYPTQWGYFAYRGKAVLPASVGVGDSEIARAKDVLPERRHAYAVYFSAVGGGTPTDASHITYDLRAAPVDVCVRFGAGGYLGSASFDTNTARISASELAQLLARR